MYTIEAHFERFADILLPDLIAATGVYVVWDSQAYARPTYIGEGVVLKRLADHARHGARRFALPWDGYVALIEGSTRAVHKDEGRAVERLLLDVARDTDRMPKVNAHPGAASLVTHFCRNENLRVVVSGYDPLLAPRENRPLKKIKQIKVRLANGGYAIDHDWYLRRLRRPLW